MNDAINNLNANRHIYEAIRAIARHRLMNTKGAMDGTRKICGYVKKIHTEGELCGTVDVQEYLSDPLDIQKVEDGIPVGLHEGVYLSSIQENSGGVLTIPLLYSDVVIVTDPDTRRDYVVQYSHAQTVQLDAHEQVSVGVTETEDFQETEDSPDVPDLAPTGKKAHTVYTSDSAVTTVESGQSQSDRSTVKVMADHVDIQHDKAKLMLDAQQILAKYNAKEIVINGSGVFIGNGNATEPGVLGNQLAAILLDLTKALSQVMTATMLGPQPPANLAQFVALQAKIATYQSSISGFLSKTVKIAE